MGGPSGQYPFGGWWRGRSIAGPGHADAREIARRKRQAERNAERQAARKKAAERKGRRFHPAITGLSRRGYPVTA